MANINTTLGKRIISIAASNKANKNIAAWIIMIPSLLLFCFFVWEPLLESIFLSFFSSKGMRLEKFVGISNYIAVFKHPDFKYATVNTFYYTFWSLLIGFLVPIIMAIILNEVIYLKGFSRVAVYLPSVVPGLAVAMMWLFIFKPSDTGLLNTILNRFGLEPQVWLANPKWTIPLIVLTMTWRGAGATTLIYLAGLQGINPELYEAAVIDGASIRQRIWYITIPNNASISLMQLVYRYAFEKFDYPKAASVSVI